LKRVTPLPTSTTSPARFAAHDERVLDPPGEDVAIIALEPIEWVDRDGVIFDDNLVLARPSAFRGFDDQGRLFGGKPGCEVRRHRVVVHAG
jgi:hypothetical protein